MIGVFELPKQGEFSELPHDPFLTISPGEDPGEREVGVIEIPYII